MTEHDLRVLKDLPVPAPRQCAKRQAIAEAMAAFEDGAEAGDEADDDMSDAPYELAGVAPQEMPEVLRQTVAFPEQRMPRMSLATRPNYALAASLAALVIVAPIAFKLHQNTGQFAPADLATVAKTQPTVVTVSPNSGIDHKIVGDILEPAASPSPVAPPGLTREKLALEAAKSDDFAEVAAKVKSLQIDQRELELKGADPASPVLPPMARLGAGGDAGSNMTLALGAKAPEPVPASPYGAGLAAGNGAGGPTVQSAAVMPPPPPASSGYVAGQPYDRAARINGILAYTGEDGRAAMQARLDQDAAQPVPEEFRDKFDGKDINPVKQVATEPVSTFSIDVDTASYSFVRRALNAGQLPPKDAVRVEELINYFPYAYPTPETIETPFKPTVTVLPSPWNPNNKLVHVAIKGYEIKAAERPRANLVFLVDVSGSMQGEDRLPLVKNALRLLIDELKPDDTVSLVTYAGDSGIALEPTKVSERAKIASAIDKLGSGGSTAGAAGIHDAYSLAEANFDKAAINRVILATDGDFNVGITDQDQLKGLIERKRKSGIFLSVLGFGRSNYNDALMQALAQNGNGTAAYIDTLNEARKVLVDDASSTLFPIAKDVKIQVEWNPERIAEYRLIGYETRALKREDFNNDRVDAGEIGSGHAVTAIYEVTPVGAPLLVDDLRYSKKLATAGEAPSAETRPVPVPVNEAEKNTNELGFLKMRYKRPDSDQSQLTTVTIADSLAVSSVDASNEDVRFSVAVSAFGQLLRGAPYMLNYDYDDVLKLAQSARGSDAFGYRAEFLNLVRLAKSARP